MDFDWDCIVVGGGPAGLSAALMLGRARRRVLVLDSGAPRNHAARAMHGVLGHDGLDPAALRARGAEELAHYGIEVRSGEAAPERARALDGGIEVDGERARALILATGLLDATPATDGFADIYGVSAHTCPYCDGWEHRDRRLAVLAPGSRAEHLAQLLRQWSADVVLFTDGGDGVDGEVEAELREGGVEVVRDPIERFRHSGGHLEAVDLAGREAIPRDALFFHIDLRPRTALAAALGCELDDSGFVVADPLTRETTVERVYAAGNCTDQTQSVSMAIGDGVRAGVAVNVRLVGERRVQPLGDRGI